MRKAKGLKTKAAIVVIVDGKDEKWYINKAKTHCNSDAMRRTKLVPELPTRKSIKESIKIAETKANAEYDNVILIVDFNQIKSNNNELHPFSPFGASYNKVVSGVDSKAINRWIKNCSY